MFLIFAQNIDCGYQQSMFWSKNKTNTCRYIPLYPSFNIYKSGVQGGYTLNGHVILMKIEPPHGKTNNLHRRKQRRSSASR